MSNLPKLILAPKFAKLVDKRKFDVLLDTWETIPQEQYVVVSDAQNIDDLNDLLNKCLKTPT